MLKKEVNLVFVLVFFCVILSIAVAEEWKAVDNRILSHWGENVSPQNVWQEYPRPQLVRDNWQSLNGLWEYALQLKTAPAPSEYSKKILVPFCAESALSGIGDKVTPEDRIWYRRTFEIAKDWYDKRIILNFEAVDWECAVWVNDAYVGSHKGAYDRITFDITDYLKKQGSQKLVVSAWDPTNLGTQARGKQRLLQRGIWYTPVSGIWQTVWLEAVPQSAAIREVKIIPDVDSKSVTVIPMLFEPKRQKYEVIVTVLDSGKQIAQNTVEVDKAVTLKIDNPKLWSPDAPFLYDLTIDLVKSQTNDQPQKSIETLKSYFGMRKISLGDGPFGKVLCLNDKPLFHYGTLDQGWWPGGLHTPPSDEAMKHDIEMTKKMGFNMIRKHIKIEPARWYYWCDKLGIMVWQDMPSGMVVLPQPNLRNRMAHPQQVQHNTPDIQRRTENASQFEYEMKRMIDLHGNAPSIVIWIPFNEGWGQYDTERICNFIKNLDPTRLVNAVSGWAIRPCGDIYDIHTYGEKVKIPPMQADRATVIGEYGGIGYPIKEHLWNPEMRNWGYQTYGSAEELYEKYVAKFDQIAAMQKKGLSAAVYTQTTDVEGEINGLMTYDRKVIKIDPEKLNKLHSVLYK